MTFSFKSAYLACKNYVTEKVMPVIKTPGSIMRICTILSAYTLIAFNIPLFKEVYSRVDGDWNGIWILTSFLIAFFVLNFLTYYILLYLGRIVGKCIITLTFICNAASLYFINTYNAYLDRSMMGNVFGTQIGAEASNFLSWTLFWYILFLGIVPCVWLFYKKIRYGSIWRFLASFFASLLIIVGVLFGNRGNITWMTYNGNDTAIGSRILPWSYIVNSLRYYSYWKMMNQPEIKLPDAEIVTDSKDICVLIIGESARSGNFSLYGYGRETNPLLAKDSVTVLNAIASDNYTRAAVKAILSDRPGDKLYELLPNYLQRNGVDVIWRTNSWGHPPLHVTKNYDKSELKERFPEADMNYDGILFHNLKEDIMASDSTKIFVGIHTYTSHGPAYYSNVPQEHKAFFPECTTVEMAKANRSHLINSYDNTILYTDYLVHSVIETLKNDFPDRRSCVIFISDHGESLGEGGYYMHGLPKQLAPACQLEIPFIVWTSDDTIKIKNIKTAGHYNIYHSVLKFLGMKTPIYDESKNIFE
jgi:lipid A ethanolaminephosphotransferase